MPELGKATYVVEIDSRDFDKELDRLDKRTKKSTVQQEKDINRIGSAWDETTDHIDDATDANREHERETRKTTVKVTKSVDKQTSAWSKLVKQMWSVNTVAKTIGGIVGIMKIPALIAALGAAAQGVNALAAGLVGLVGSLSQVSGMLAALPGIVGSALQGMIAFRVSGVSKVFAALGPLNEKLDTTSTAFKALSPSAQRFAKELDKLKSPLKDVQESVQRPVFRGMQRGIESAMGAMPMFQKELTRTGQVLGGIFERFGKMVGGSGFGERLGRVMQSNSRTLGAFGAIGAKLTRTLVILMDSARPLVKWFRNLAKVWADNIQGAVRTGEETGRLGKFFERTQRTMSRLFSIIGNLTKGLVNLGSMGAKVIGRDLLRAIDNLTKGFAGWTESKKGREEMRDWFKSAKKPLWEFGRLLGAIGEAFFDISGNNSVITQFMRVVRKDLLPIFVDIVKSTTKNFGPALLDFFAEFGELLGSFAGASSPLVWFLKGLTKLAEGLNWLADRGPGVKAALVTIASGFGVISALGMAKFTSELFGFRKGLETIRKFPGMDRLFNSLKSGFETLALKGMYAKEAAMNWVGEFAGGIKAKGGRVVKAAKNVLAKIGGKSVALLQAGTSAAAGWAGAMGEKIAKMKPKFIKMGSGAGKWVGRGLVIGLVLAMPLLLPEAYKLGEKLGKQIAKPLRDVFIVAVRWIIDRINDVIDALNKINPFGDIGHVTDPGVLTSGELKAARRASRQAAKGSAAAYNAVAGIGGGSPFPNLQLPSGGQSGGLVVSGGILPFQGYQAGGLVGSTSRPPGPRDTVPAMLQPGEMVLPVDMVKRMGKQTGDGSKILKKFHKFNDDTFKEIRKKTGAENEDTRKKLLKEYERMNKDGTKEADRLKDSTIDRMIRTKDASSKSANTMRSNVSASFKNMTSAGKSALKELADAVNKALDALNVKPVDFGVSTGGSSGGRDTSKTPPKKATGGVVVPGQTPGDRHTLALNGQPIAKVESGEQISVLNRTATAAQMAMNRTFPRKSGSGRPSWLSKKAKHALGGIVRLAQGGVAEPPGDPGTEVVQAAYAKAVGKFLRRFDMNLTQGYNPGGPSVSPGHLSLSAAPSLDVVPLDGNWDGAFAQGLKWALAQGMQVGYDGQYGTQAWSGHGEGNHAHIDWGGDTTAAGLPAGGAVTAVVKKLKRVLITGPDGVYKTIAQKSVDKVRNAADKFLQKKAGAGANGFISGGAGDVPAVMGHILLRAGLDREGAAGIIGNAYAESNWNPAAMEPGTHNGGLFGFTTPPVSLANMQAYANKIGKPWTDVSAQVNFMLKNGFEGAVRSAVMAANTPEDAAERFMTLWERPGIPRLDVRQAAARKAYNMKSWATGGVLPPYAGAFAKGGRVPGPIGAPRTAIVHGGEDIRPAAGAVVSGRARPNPMGNANARMSGRMKIENWRDGTAYFEVLAEDVAEELIDADRRSSRRG